MKKIYIFLVVALMVSMSLPAQKVGYLLTESAITSLPDEDGQKPEQNAANWFVSAYGSNAELVSLSDLASLDPATVKVLWINIDRSSFSEDQFNAIFTDEIVTSIKTYVEAGGNLLLTKQAARLAHRTGRIGYTNNWSDVGYHDGGDTWYIKTKLGGGTANPTDRSNHAIYKNIAKNDNGEFALVGPVKRSDRNNNWGDFFRKDPNTGGILDGSDPSTHYDNGNVQRLFDFEGDWNCEALATWPHIQDYCLPMIINFKPGYETFTGGMLAICLAAYQWGTANNDATNIGNVRRLTQNSIEYLYGSDPRPQVEASWNVTPADGVIGGSMTASVTTTGTISWSSSDNTVASVSSEGVITYNGFGSCTITAVVSKDGFADKNLTQTITATGGVAATYAYALPYSLYTMQHYDNEEGFYPDYQAAKWFYDNYVAPGTGCFIDPTAYSTSTAFPSAINVLWVNNDHVGLARDTYYDNLGGNNFKDALEAFVKAGGKVFLSKQATRLAHDIGRVSVAPEYRMNGWQGRDDNTRYMTADFYALKDADENRVGLDRHNHPVYKYLPAEAWVTHNEGGQDVYCKWQLMDFAADRRTDNNAIWENHWDGYADAVHLARATKFEEDHHCIILGGYGHTTALDGAGFVEFYPTDTYSGTMVALGLCTYQWGTNNSMVSRIQNLTQGVLEYLNSADIYTRTVTANHYGTICLPRASASLSDGMTVYRVLSDQTDGIMLEEVNTMEAGVPYFFYSTATQISVTMTGAAVLAPQNGNGLIGNFGPASVEIPNETDNYILGSDNTLYYIDKAGIMLGANRAYLDRSAINEGEPVAGMPKRKMGIHYAPNAATAIEETESDANQPVKRLINGRLVIQHRDKLYDATGAQIH